MATFQQIESDGVNSWTLVRPESILDAFRLAWILWRHPDRSSVLMRVDNCHLFKLAQMRGPEKKKIPEHAR